MDDFRWIVILILFATAGNAFRIGTIVARDQCLKKRHPKEYLELNGSKAFYKAIVVLLALIVVGFVAMLYVSQVETLGSMLIIVLGSTALLIIAGMWSYRGKRHELTLQYPDICGPV